MAVPHEMVGFATTNAGPTMFAFGGRERVVGNNPDCLRHAGRTGAAAGAGHGNVDVGQ